MAYKIISRKIKYSGLWAKIEEARVKLPTGKVAVWESVLADDAVAIVAIDKDKNIYLSKEWRVTWRKEIIQIPGGICKEKTESGFLAQAKNELAEELSLGAKNWEKLITFLLAGRQRTKFHIFLAQDLYESKKEPDENEIVKVIKMPFAKAYSDFMSGKIPALSYTLVGLALAKEKLKL